MTSLPGALVFDLDGTLIDSRRDIATAVNAMRAALALPPLSGEEVVGMVGEGARVLVRRALPPETAKDALDAALASYRAHYNRVLLDTTRAYPGIKQMLAGLTASMPLTVLSNKGETNSRHILDQLGLGRYLREIVGGDTLPTRKPNPGGMFLLADRLHLAPERLLLVGDSSIDAETAQAAGCPFALALWGTPRLPGADALTAQWRFSAPAELAAAFGGGTGETSDP